MKKIIWTLFVYTILAVIIVPSVITFFYGVKASGPQVEVYEPAAEQQTGNIVKVYNPETEEIIESALEDYIKGVVSAEMPANFSEEALKAQAVAARTYAVKSIADNKEAADNLPESIGQAYLDQVQMKEKWGVKFNENYQKICDAVESTQGEILMYDNEPILAVFHSTSAGKTQNAADVWGKDLPYLVSVDSSKDTQAPEFETEMAMSEETIVAKLQEKYPDLVITEGGLLPQMQVMDRTEAGYVNHIQVGNKILTGPEFRQIVGLRSNNFTLRQSGNDIIFTVKGYGHGAGMSQYGANYLAEEGYTYKEILFHYYTGAQIQKMSDLK